MSKHDDPTIAELLDQVDDERQREATRRRVESARAELQNTAELLAELAEDIPADLDEMTRSDFAHLLNQLQLASNCLEAETDTGRVALDSVLQFADLEPADADDYLVI